MEFLVLFVFGGIAAAIASSKGRNPWGWFFVGFCAPCLGLILLLVLGDLKKEEAAKKQLRDENRRLRETVRKDRMVADSRHEATSSRLSAHDRAQGIDTASMTDAGEGGAPPPLVTEAASPNAGGKTVQDSLWFYAQGSERLGPVEFDELRRFWLANEIQSDTMVWRTGQGDWAAISELGELVGALES